MKIVFVNRFFYPDHSATSQMLSDLAFHLAATGDYPICVITSRQRYDKPDARLLPTEQIHGVDIIRVATPRFGRGNLIGRLVDYLGFYIAATWVLLRTVERGDIVVAKTDPPLISIPAAVICRLRGARLINWLQDLFPEVAIALGVRGARGPLGRLLLRWRNWSLQTACMNVAIGERMRELLLTEGISAERIVVIHNWADGTAIIPVVPAENPLRKEWGLDEKFVVGYSGNLGRAHEFETLIGTAEQLRDRADIVFLIIGGGAQARRMEKAAALHGLSNLMFKPYQPRERLHHSLTVADIHLAILRPELEGLIVPSKYYGIAAAGRPTLFIGAGDGEIARIIHENDCGFTVAPGDTAALTAAILTARSDASGKQGENARRSFEAVFDMPRAMQVWRQTIAAASRH